jgi:hypothetical protein
VQTSVSGAGDFMDIEAAADSKLRGLGIVFEIDMPSKQSGYRLDVAASYNPLTGEPSAEEWLVDRSAKRLKRRRTRVHDPICFLIDVEPHQRTH